MASCSATDVETIAPEFTPLGATVINTFIGFADSMFTAAAFGARAQVAEAYLTAHLLAVAHPELYRMGPAMMQRVGQVSVQNAMPMPNPGDLASSRYGIEYRRQVSLNGLGLGVL